MIGWPNARCWAGWSSAIPVIARNLLGTVGHSLQETQTRVPRAADRAGRAPHRPCPAAGRPPRGGAVPPVRLPPPPRQELAELAGTTLYTVSRTLSAWEDQGIVESGRGPSSPSAAPRPWSPSPRTLPCP